MFSTSSLTRAAAPPQSHSDCQTGSPPGSTASVAGPAAAHPTGALGQGPDEHADDLEQLFLEQLFQAAETKRVRKGRCGPGWGAAGWGAAGGSAGLGRGCGGLVGTANG